MASLLIVEDNPSFRLSLREILSSRFPQIVVNEAGSSEEALERMESPRPDVMLVDISLPGQNGLELTRRVRKDFTDITVVILTNYDLPEFREAARRHGVDFFFSKSTSSMEEILAAVSKILRRKGETGQDMDASSPGPGAPRLN